MKYMLVVNAVNRMLDSVKVVNLQWYFPLGTGNVLYKQGLKFLIVLWKVFKMWFVNTFRIFNRFGILFIILVPTFDCYENNWCTEWIIESASALISFWIKWKVLQVKIVKYWSYINVINTLSLLDSNRAFEVNIRSLFK